LSCCGLFGGHVTRRAEDGIALRLTRLVEALGKTEVGDFRRAVGGQQDVRRLQVAMHDTHLWADSIASARVCTNRAAALPSSGVPASFCARLPPATKLERQIRQAVVVADFVDLERCSGAAAAPLLRPRP